MTQMGINYLNYLETNRANVAGEKLKDKTLLETMRHNLVGERHMSRDLEIKSATLDESVRSNKAREKETKRTNLAHELLGEKNYLETQRSNKAKEYENYRSNVAKETELNRSNKAHEIELNRSNIARETETNRRNTLDSLDDYSSAAYAYETGVDVNPVNAATFVVGQGLSTLKSLMPKFGK